MISLKKKRRQTDMPDGNRILDKINRGDAHKRKRVVLICAVSAAAIAIICVFVILAVRHAGKEKTRDNVSFTGDAKYDPENADLSREEGSEVDASLLIRGKDRANGIDVSKWQGSRGGGALDRAGDSGIQYILSGRL